MNTENTSIFAPFVNDDEITDFLRMMDLTKLTLNQKLSRVETLPGGLTNKNFKVFMEDGTLAAVRMAGQGTANYINRPAEKHNAAQMAGIGIAPEIYYYDPKSGSQICEFIEADTMHPEDFQTRDEVLTSAAKVMRRYHDSGIEFKSRFNPIAKTKEYLEILKEHGYDKRYEGWDRMSEALDRIEKAYAVNPPKQVPCHNDTLAENFMYNGRVMRVIDWEYGGMNDGYYDIACVCVENPLNEECEAKYLEAYCGGEPTEEQKARVLISKFLVTTHWSTWSLVQICYGKDEEFYWEYGRTRAVDACSFLDNPNFEKYAKLIGCE
ncbi:Thiamine kinase [uncultured Roseburia sp.]|uniref:Phosphotransferase family protein n=1 Tax=Brotonthovivens ammoniilytica TaxID=2981725 RepID=A0ABT2TGS4_9FIRM|nr:choline/ethanolamine kinase family protein [Brotonthovivens ammoniilytica]MCU6760784.1 phosphotransferase family protein [Brotonthovivens ammoniilytica]SCI09147.1 Thiamine kinase [uncultured Roseburia sp.]